MENPFPGTQAATEAWVWDDRQSQSRHPPNRAKRHADYRPEEPGIVFDMDQSMV